jgi:acyl dehydratase
MASTEMPEVGQEIPAFVRETGLENWNRYAAVNDEFVGIHMDDAAGQAAGYPTAFGMGNLQWSYLHNLVREWAGERGKIERLSCQFRGPNVKGQTVTARGRVIAVRPGPERTEVDLEVWTTDQEGNQLAPGNATVSFPTAG